MPLAGLPREHDDVLLEDLLEAVLEQDLGGLGERHRRVHAVELDVGAPRQQDEEEAARQQRQQRRQEAFQGAELEALDGLMGSEF